MSARTPVDSLMVELHRFGEAASSIRRGERYIRTMGGDAPVLEVTMDLGEEDFLRSLNRLRYDRERPAEDVEAASRLLSTHAGKILPKLPPPAAGHLLQVDLVTGAAELWAFPFEACSVDGQPLFATRANPVVLTRRIRGEFVARAGEWPAVPRVLFVHAPAAPDLSKDLIAQHVAALREALTPWRRGSSDADLLTVVEVNGAIEVRMACEAARQEPRDKPRPYTHVHLLAHGAAISDPDLPQRQRWGLRLGFPGTDPVMPEELRDALRPAAKDGLPIVVTLASCDAANQAESGMPTRSFAQELHFGGVPVVLAPQLPLTKPGSVVFARSFYTALLRGEDVRVALHEARVSLYESHSGHDWLGLVAYVRLPEGYDAHLDEVGLRAELALLDAAQGRADRLSLEGGTEKAFGEVEELVLARIDSLTARLAALDDGRKGLAEECQGLLASAQKRLAELRFVRSRAAGPSGAAHRAAEREALEAALVHYRSTFQSNVHHHWTGVQQLALEAVLHGRFEYAADWGTVMRAAELQRDRTPPPGKSPDYWSCGSIAEAHLLAPVAGRARALDAARDALELFKKRAGTDAWAVESTRRQLRRYMNWWTSANGYFPGREDLAADATALLKTLD